MAATNSSVTTSVEPSTTRVNKSAVMDLPNMLLATTYAINKSNSKRIAVGLEYYAGFYRAVVKLCSTGSPAKYVTLDTHSWETFADQLDGMDGYLQDSFTYYHNFGKPTKIFLQNHDISFTTAYGSKAIAIDERPHVPPAKYVRDGENEPEAQQFDEESQSTNPPITETPVAKKRKYNTPPGIVMQQATVSGLRDVRECVDACLRRLNEYSGFINKSVDNIIAYLKEEIKKEETEKAQSILKDSAAFKQYYTLRREEINNRARIHIEFSNVNSDLFNTILLELYAFGLINLAQDLYECMFPL